MFTTLPKERRLPRPASLVRGKRPRRAVRCARSPREGRALVEVSERLSATKMSHALRSRVLRRGV
eukprot:4619034-Alexandrium_andersonii.AAC.1